MNEYQRNALETAIYPADQKIIYPTLGLAGEAGEVADKVKKIIRDTEVIRDKDSGAMILNDEQRRQLALEIGDVLWYCATLSYDLGYTLQQVADMNYEKLKSRQERGKIHGSGDER